MPRAVNSRVSQPSPQPISMTVCALIDDSIDKLTDGDAPSKSIFVPRVDNLAIEI
jgi:hypothetical protein